MPMERTGAASYLVGSTGLFADLQVNTGPGDMWFTGANSLTGGLTANFVTFNLGGLYTLNAMKVWMSRL